MDGIEVSSVPLFTKGQYVVGLGLESPEGAMFLFDLDSVFEEGDMMSNKVNELVCCE